MDCLYKKKDFNVLCLSFVSEAKVLYDVILYVQLKHR